MNFEQSENTTNLLFNLSTEGNYKNKKTHFNQLSCLKLLINIAENSL